MATDFETKPSSPTDQTKEAPDPDDLTATIDFTPLLTQKHHPHGQLRLEGNADPSVSQVVARVTDSRSIG